MKSLTASCAALGLALLLTACQEEEKQPTSPATAESRSQADPASASRAPAARSAMGDCDLFTKEELTAAFGSRLTFADPSGFRDRGNGCTVSVRDYEGQFMLQAESREAYEARRDTYLSYQDQGSATMVPVSIGAEAYLVNSAQIIAIDAQGRAITAALQLFVFGGELPLSKEEVAAGVEDLARKALDRL